MRILRTKSDSCVPARTDYAILQIGRRLKFCTVWFIIIVMIIHIELFSYWLAKIRSFWINTSPTDRPTGKNCLVPRAPKCRVRAHLHSAGLIKDFREMIESDRFSSTRYFRFLFFNGKKSRKCIWIWCAFDFDYDFICSYFDLTACWYKI